MAMYTKELKAVLKEVFVHHVHSGINHNSQKAEATQMSINRGIDE